MPSIDVDVASVPDIIEAQLTLSYSRLTDVIRVIVEQGNGNADDIEDMRDALDRLSRENEALRAEVDALKQAKGPAEEVMAALGELKGTVAQLNDAVAANAAQVKASEEAQKAAAAQAEKRAAEAQAAMKNTFDRHADAVEKRVAAAETSLRLVRAFVDLWGAPPEQVLEMGSRTSTGSELEHSLEERTRYLLSLPAFARTSSEMEVLRALLQRQSADALAAKTSEAARTSRKASLIAAADGSDFASELESLNRAVRSLEQDVRAVQQQRLPPLESAVRDLQARPNPEKRLTTTERDVSRLYDHLAQLENRLSALLGHTEQSGTGEGGSSSGGEAAHPGLVDLARRVSLLEGTVEGWPQAGGAGFAADVARAAGGEQISTDAAPAQAAAAAPVRPPSRGGSAGSPLAGRPPSGRAGGAVLPALAKESLSGSAAGSPVYGAAVGTATPTPRRGSSSSHDLVQPTVDVLRRQDAAQPNVVASGRRISVAVEPDDGLRRRVIQLEENAAILEVNKADRKELRALEESLRLAIGSAAAAQQQQRAHSASFAQNPAASVPQQGYAAPPLVPQRPGSASGSGGARCAVSDYALSQQQAAQQGYSRPTSSAGAIGRPMFVGASASVYLRDGAQLTNATVSSTVPYRQS